MTLSMGLNSNHQKKNIINTVMDFVHYLVNLLKQM